MSVVVDAGPQATGTLQVLRPGIANGTLSDSLVENNQWRIDFKATQGQSIEFVLPGSASRNVHLVNLLQQQGTALTIYGTDAADSVKVDLSNGLVANVAGISYQLDNTIKSVVVDAGQNNDTLSLIGSKGSEKVELRPGLTTLESTQLTVRATGFENVQFQGGGGPDRAYLYDAATDDRLSIWPNKAELTGVGYSFNVSQIDRIFVHANQGGDDQAFVFDSAGDDALSVRPQFTSLAGTGYFNYVAGFERVFAYSNAGGVDSAALYDSVGNDLFSTSGEVTSIVGSGFSTFARGFENVEAFSNAGGVDRASVYAPVGGKLTSGADFVGMQDATRSSIARNFERVETFLPGQTVATPVRSNALETLSEDSAGTIDPIALMPAAGPVPVNVPVTIETTLPMANVGMNECEAVFDKMDWIANLVENEVRQMRFGPSEAGIPAIDKQSAITDRNAIGLDLTWIDRDLERAALDEIFAKHV